jgi:ABC-2 type transport system permease protein
MNSAAMKAETRSITAWQQYLWSLRREFWENRAIYLGPLAVAAVFLVGYFFSVVVTAHMRVPGAGHGMDTAKPITPYDIAAGLMMLTTMVISVFYTLDALYGERRDRSVLFWKSLPVSDLTTVLAKATIPIVVLPLVGFAVGFVTQFLMLSLNSAAVAAKSGSVAELWEQISFGRMSLLFLYHMVTGHGLWWAPLYAWMLLVSAWARRTPFLWAFLPPVVLCYLEWIALHSNHLWSWLSYRLGGGMDALTAPGTMPTHPMTHITPLRFFSSAGLWDGLIFTAICLYLAAWLRRHRDPV